MIIPITNENFHEVVEKSSKPVVIDVFASWCGPCQMVAPVFDEVSNELAAHYVFANLNVDEARDISIKFGVTSVPTFLFIKNGAVVGRETGYMAKERLKEKISTYLG